ncbi:transporter substrate-binding domain-containing protein [Pollutimonas sp. M17]|uniref:transporter substrate-binding domain-containing protein n=1 Tax=Pollutimonas sp. M17 TaxID=2962065 RepID=UPI0021F4B5D4|nr:transporter substrate-binding domain-containing protein [Pollutimonas sp. M17]UYO93296.1 transporter substrate-binding domain-containing protein [Pollutimonas sp. M17]HWK72278.1 transporter substrate-binding domain-containing protein [Burkholderiaceae bacterium]
MSLKKALYFTLIAACLGAVAGTASADALSDIKAAKKIRVGIDLGAPFYGYVDEKMQPVGSDVEAARLLAKDLGVELEIVQTTNSARIPNLLSNKADLIISSLSITPERAKAVDFSIPYGAIQAAVGAPKSLTLKGMDDLAGKAVAVTRGGPQDKLVSEGAPKAKVVRFDDEAASITAAATGQADIVAITPPIIKAISKRNPEREFEVKFVIQSYRLGVAMRKNEPALKDWVNGWIRTNLKNGKLNEIHLKYAGVPIPEEIIEGAK